MTFLPEVPAPTRADIYDERIEDCQIAVREAFSALVAHCRASPAPGRLGSANADGNRTRAPMSAFYSASTPACKRDRQADPSEGNAGDSDDRGRDRAMDDCRLARCKIASAALTR